MSSADETVRTGGGGTLHRTDDNGEPLCDKIGEGQTARETDLSKFPPAWRNWCTVCEFIDEHGSYPSPSDYPLTEGNDE